VINPARDASHSDLQFVQEDEVLIASRGEAFKGKNFSKAIVTPRKPTKPQKAIKVAPPKEAPPGITFTKTKRFTEIRFHHRGSVCF
jgi:hypothetical protein